MLTRQDVAHEIDREIAGAPEASMAVLLLRAHRYRQEHILFDNHLNGPIGERLRQGLRPGDRLFEIGENRFALLLPGLHDGNHARLAASRFVRSFDDPLAQLAGKVLVTPTIGIALYPEHGTKATDLLDAAELAFEHAAWSNERYFLASAGRRPRVFGYEQLRDAIQQNRLEVSLQPIWDLQTDRMFGAESLARWHDPEFGTVQPSEFVLLAEQTGLIGGLTRWSLNSTLRQCANLLARRPDLHVAVNLSPRVFHDPGIVEQVVGAAQIWDVPNERIVLEVTETVVMEDVETSARVLHRLRDAGFGIAIDDFGIGYSTYASLRRFPATELKIDQSFVRDLPTDPRATNVVASMVALGHGLGMRVVGEGVETEGVASSLRALGCDLAQGYWFGAPETAAAFIAGVPER